MASFAAGGSVAQRIAALERTAAQDRQGDSRGPPPLPTLVQQRSRDAADRRALEQSSGRGGRSRLSVDALDASCITRTAHVGGGTYGQVYKATLSFGGERVVAVKTFTTTGPAADLDGHAVTAAVREAKVMQKLRHPNLVQILGMVLGGADQQLPPRDAGSVRRPHSRRAVALLPQRGVAGHAAAAALAASSLHADDDAPGFALALLLR